jgi:hypothetical protein
MKVFHGSNLVVSTPKIKNRFKTLDFGIGFYTTENEKQAQEFALKVFERRGGEGVPTVSCFEFRAEFEEFRFLNFDKPDEKWLDFVVANRKGGNLSKNFDIVRGPVANDDVFATIILYEDGTIDKETTIKRFKVKTLFNQILFANDIVLKNLEFSHSYEVKNDI